MVLQSMDGVCYSGQPGHNTEAVKLEIGPNDAASAYFPIIPLEIGEFPIRVMAVSSWGRDAVEKTLRVEVSQSRKHIHIKLSFNFNLIYLKFYLKSPKHFM